MLSNYYFNFYGIDIDGREVNIDSEFLELSMKEKPEEIFTLMKSEVLDISTMDSALYTDNNTFQNTEIEFEFFVKADREQEVRKAIIDIIKCNKGKISFGWDTEHYYNCRLSTNPVITEFDIIGEYYGELILALEIEPYKYVKGGDDYVRDHLGRVNIENGSIITNFYDTSYPLIHITVPNQSELDTYEGEKQFEITLINNDIATGVETHRQSMLIKGYTVGASGRRMCIDTKNQYSYAIDDNYGENMNNLIDINSEYFNFKPGEITIQFSENFIKANRGAVNIIANWRSL